MLNDKLRKCSTRHMDHVRAVLSQIQSASNLIYSAKRLLNVGVEHISEAESWNCGVEILLKISDEYLQDMAARFDDIDLEREIEILIEDSSPTPKEKSEEEENSDVLVNLGLN